MGWEERSEFSENLLMTEGKGVNQVKGAVCGAGKFEELGTMGGTEAR